MDKKLQTLPEHYYFEPGMVPVAVKRVEGGQPSHRYDYTGTEHRHAFTEIAIVREGSGRHCINGSEGAVAAGDVFVLLRGTRHYFPDRRSLHLVNVMFSPHLFDSMRTVLNRIPGYNVMFRIDTKAESGQLFPEHLRLTPRALPRALETVSAIEHALADTSPSGGAAACARLLDLILFLSHCREMPEESERSETRLGALLSRLETDFSKPWTLDKMAGMMYLSANQFLRVFRSAAGMSPMQYLIRLRIEAGKRLLLETDRSVSEIAFQCGFSDSNYFSKQFVKQCGCPPKQYRSGHRTAH